MNFATAALCGSPSPDRINEKMRVLVVSQHFWPETFRINEVVESLRSCGCDVEVLSGQPNYPHGQIFEGYRALSSGTQIHPSGYLIHRVPVVPRGKGGGLRRVWNYLSFVVSGSIIGLFLTRSKRYDIVFVYANSPILQGLVGAVFRQFKSAAHVIWVQDLWPDNLEETGFVRNQRVLSAVEALTRFIYQRSDLLLAQSRGFIAKIRAVAGDAVPIAYHPNPGDLNLAVDSKFTGSPLDLTRGFNVVFAGNLGSAQALETVLDAAGRISDPEINIVLVGSGSRSEWLRTEIERLHLTNVMLVGRFPQEAMPAVFAQASALLVTLNRAKGLGLTVPSKLPTYLAAGRPILACLDGEAADIVSEAKAGLVVPAEDSIALAEAIIRLKGLPRETREAMGTAGREYFNQHFAPGPLALDLVEHFRRALRERRASRR
ncbi:MAG: glycosyltransferase WbuB [Mesorhizobium sp.]|uniref:glycosyltransferase family 4 protein n=1 Tax=Mesorhizobium sp. TaxID=1871066 RepID=UPI000FE496EB|nr:glycosyltransferase family 4 protein [Mesorhizobium sp.]RWP86623.1 MAG: glycosyltransferase WbuB [Mesorhizobium sp.]